MQNVVLWLDSFSPQRTQRHRGNKGLTTKGTKDHEEKRVGLLGDPSCPLWLIFVVFSSVYAVSSVVESKAQLQRELQHPRAAAAQAGIGLRHVGGLRDHACRSGLRVDRSISIDCRHYRVARQCEIRVIENVKELCTELHGHAL